MISNIRLQNWRSYRDETFEFDTGVTIIVGPNASGKTNLLEAIQVVCMGSSYRAKPDELIQFKKDWARLEASSSSGPRVVKLDRRSGLLKKSFVINGQELTRLQLHRTLPVVIFEPDHLLMLSGGPELRRDYIDGILSQTISGYDKLRRDYRRALSQRNSLLKRAEKDHRSQLFAWNLRLSQLGGQMVKQRLALIDQVAGHISRLYQRLADSKAKLSAQYYSSLPLESYENALLKKLEASVELDYLRGFTAYGPHRDDLQLFINSRPIQDVASRGESRTVLLSLKLVELQVIEIARGEKPLLLLDDVFSELDGARRLALTRFLRDYQTFITTTDADVVVQHFMDKATIVPVRSS